jgi:hypothetical protein
MRNVPDGGQVVNVRLITSVNISRNTYLSQVWRTDANLDGKHILTAISQYAIQAVSQGSSAYVQMDARTPMNAPPRAIHVNMFASIHQDHINVDAEKVTTYKPMDETVQILTNAQVRPTVVNTNASIKMEVSNVVVHLVTHFRMTKRVAMT